MNVRLFGAVSSLSCSNFCLKKAAAEDSTKEVEVEASDVLKKYFYVEDCLRSQKTENLAIERIKGVRRACARRGFHLYQQKKVLNTVPEEERSKNVCIVDLNSEQLQIERALGVQWLVESDVFEFRIILKDYYTKWYLVRAVSSI